MDMYLKIVSPEKVVFEGGVDSVGVPGTVCPFVILKNHAPIISSLVEGVVSYVSEDGEHSIKIAGGFVEVQKNEIRLAVEEM